MLVVYNALGSDASGFNSRVWICQSTCSPASKSRVEGRCDDVRIAYRTSRTLRLASCHRVSDRRSHDSIRRVQHVFVST